MKKRRKKPYDRQVKKQWSEALADFYFKIMGCKILSRSIGTGPDITIRLPNKKIKTVEVKYCRYTTKHKNIVSIPNVLPSRKNDDLIAVITPCAIMFVFSMKRRVWKHEAIGGKNSVLRIK